MHAAKMDAILDLLEPEDIRRGLWMIRVWENVGSMDRVEADEWTARKF